MLPDTDTRRLRRAETRGDEVFGRVLEMIYSGELPPGAVVNESALALRFSVSRGPIREAIRRLQGVQLVSREPFLRARVVSLSPEAVLHLFQMRAALEGYACRLAARRMSDQAMDGLIADLDAAHRGALPEGEVFDMHERLVRESGNDRIIETLCGDLYHLLRLYRRLSGAVPERRDLAYAEHWQILRAVKLRDGDLAESLMRGHIERAARHVVDHIPIQAPGSSHSAITRIAP